MVKYKQGDLFQAEETLLAHGVNCRGGFGSGVASRMTVNYPETRVQHLYKHRSEGWKLGDVQFVPSNNKIIANCATQDKFLPRGVCHADYNAIKVCMMKVKDYAKLRNLTVAMPKIGAGLAGGNWELIKLILDDVFQDYDCTVYYLE